MAEYYCVVRCNAMWSGGCLPVFGNIFQTAQYHI
jgi:hypothetical protein